MKVLVSPRAKKDLRKLPQFDQVAITNKILLFSKPILQEEKLSGFSHMYRVRMGNYRIVYKKTTELVYVILIGHRRDVYRRLSELLR